MKTTVNYHLIKPDIQDDYDIDNFNENMDVIDMEMKGIRDSMLTPAAAEQLIAGATVMRNITIPSTGWDIGAEEVADGVLYLDIPQEDITAEMIPFVQIHPAQEQTAKDCGMKAVTRSMDGKLRLYTAKAPASDMEATLVLLNAGNGTAGGGTWTISSMPVASSTTVGGVKVQTGSGLIVDSEGNLALDSASAEEVGSMLDDVYQ